MRHWAWLLPALLLLIAGPAAAQSLSLDLGGDSGSATGRIVELVAIMTVLSVVPGLLVTVTSFTRIVVVLSFLRQAMGAQTAPPNMVIVSLALFLTAFVMSPTLDAVYKDSLQPLMANRIDEMEAFSRATKPISAFMLKQVRDQDLKLFFDLSHTAPVATPQETPLQLLIPAFMISELRRAFEIGFLIYLPFLVIDMLVASVLMSMGMMMLPPATFSLPFKLIFFVLVDGWYLITGSLVQSFGQ
jgi:flagellar biosynthesis protein FliP